MLGGDGELKELEAGQTSNHRRRGGDGGNDATSDKRAQCSERKQMKGKFAARQRSEENE